MRLSPRQIYCLLLLPPLALILYAFYWGVAYRLPRSADKTIDLRSGLSRQIGPACRLVFCAGLANNPHGFPGHAYVVWAGRGASMGKSALSAEDGETLGFCPNGFWDIVPSVVQSVKGSVDDRAATGNDRNVEKLTVIVDEKTYKHTRAQAQSWDASHFRTGTRDCCAFVDCIARDAGLNVPKQQYLYPHDHILLLKQLNNSTLLESAQVCGIQEAGLKN